MGYEILAAQIIVESFEFYSMLQIRGFANSYRSMAGMGPRLRASETATWLCTVVGYTGATDHIQGTCFASGASASCTELAASRSHRGNGLAAAKNSSHSAFDFC